MDSVLDLFLGDPVYDENGRVVRRNFGIKNVLVICFTLYVFYYFLPKTTILSGMIPKDFKGSKKKGSKKKGSKGKGSKGKIQEGGGKKIDAAIITVCILAFCGWILWGFIQLIIKSWPS